MTRPAFIVDGEQEQKIVQKICDGAPVRKLGCNGKSVQLEVAAKKIASLIRLMDNRHYPYIVVFDKEDRKLSSSKIGEALLNLIRKEGITDLVVIGIPDRMIENWIIADHVMLAANGYKVPKKKTDGLHGKSEIKKACPKLTTYHETIEGVDLFLKCSAKQLYLNSPSFRQFIENLKAQHVTLDCHWCKGL